MYLKKQITIWPKHAHPTTPGKKNYWWYNGTWVAKTLHKSTYLISKKPYKIAYIARLLTFMFKVKWILWKLQGFYLGFEKCSYSFESFTTYSNVVSI